jgi:glycosyltransferase involved in cell wall biosynthesis
MTIAGRPSAGVAMCVYNGAAFVRAQLDSIAAQTELPSRLVVVDDASTDGSWELLRRWERSAPFEVLLKRNETNLGVVRNFERAIGLIDRDIIFLADQDDVWYPGKLAAFVDRFAADAALGLVHSDADLIDHEGRPLGRRLFDTLLVTKAERAEVGAGRAYRVYAKRNLVTGAACAFRRELMAHASPLSSEWIHDEWIAFTAALVSKVELLDAPTMAYRLHGSNAVGMPLPTVAWRLRTAADAMLRPAAARQLRRARRLREIREHAVTIGVSAPILDELDAAIRHADFRAHLPRNPVTRFLGVLTEWRAGNYRAWSSAHTSVLHDLLVAK